MPAVPALAALALAALAPAPGASGVLPPSDASNGASTVVIEGMRFMPQTLMVGRGQTVTWLNRDPFPHTVTSPGSFDSKSIAAGASWTFTVKKTGDYAYQCSLHPTMTGRLSVR